MSISQLPLLDTSPPWLTRCLVTILIAFIVHKIILPRLRLANHSDNTSGPLGTSASATDTSAGNGAVLDAGWEERARRGIAAQAAQVSGETENDGRGGVFTSNNTTKPKEERAVLTKKKTMAATSLDTTSTDKGRAAAKVDVIDITTTSQWEKVRTNAAKTGRPLVVKFTSSWCCPCKKIDPFYLVLARKYRFATFVRLDVDVMDEVSEEFEVDTLPSFEILANGVEVGRVSGASEMKLEELVTKHCAKQDDEAAKNESEMKGTHDSEADVVASTVASDSTSGGGMQRPSRQQARTTFRQQHNDATLTRQEPERPSLKSSAVQSGLSEFQAYYSTISDLYRQYIIATKIGEVPAPIIPRSERGNVRVSLDVLNSTNAPLDCFWVDYKGREEWKGSAAPGQVWSQITWIGHPWTFRAQGGQVLCHFVPYRVIPTSDRVSTVTRNGNALQRFTILNPSYSSAQTLLMCDIVDPIFPFPAAKFKSVDKALEWCYRQMERDGTSPRTLLKYLYNIVRNPSDPKYRQIRTANRIFGQQVWCNAGRGVLHAIGFQENGPYAEMGPATGSLSEERLKQVAGVIHNLEKLLAEMEGTGKNFVQQPEGADGYGRAGFGRVGMS